MRNLAAAACIRGGVWLLDVSDRLMPRRHHPAPRPAVLPKLHADPGAVSIDRALSEYGFAMAKAWRLAGCHEEADAWQTWANQPWARLHGLDPNAPRLRLLRGRAA